MKISKILSLLLVAMLVVGMLAACGDDTKPADNPGEDTEEPQEEVNEPKVLRLPQTADIPGLDSSLSTDTVSFEVLGNTVEGLYRLVGNNQVEKGLVEEATMSDDGLKYTFKLREDSTWSNGTPVTAHDFVYSWRKLADPQNGSQYAFMLETAAVKNIAGVMNGEKPVEDLAVTATDDYTLEVELSAPVPFFKSLMSFPSFYPINEEFASSLGEDYGTSVDNMLFNGPYVLSSWETEYEYRFAKNDNYHRPEEVKIDEVIFSIVKDTNTAVNMYEAGDIDRVGLSGENIDIYLDDPNLIDVPETVIYYLQLNQANEILKNENARRAFALSIDKTFITEEILKNGSIASDYLVPYNFANGPDGKDFRETTDLYMTEDKAKADDYWETAKSELGVDTVEIEFLTYDSEVSKKISEFIQAQLESNLDGISVSINQQPFNNKLALEDEGNFDFSFAGWGPDYGDPMTFLDMWITESGHNVMNYSNEEYDKIIYDTKQGELTTDLEARWEALQKAEKILLQEEAALIPIYQRGGKSLLRPYVSNMKLNSFSPDYYYAYIEMDK